MLRLVGGDARADEGPALVVALLLSKEDSVRERDNIRFAIPLPAIFGGRVSGWTGREVE